MPTDTAGRDRPAPRQESSAASPPPAPSADDERRAARSQRPEPPAAPDQRSEPRPEPTLEPRPESRAQPPRERAAAPRRSDQQTGGMRGFRDVVADANDLGGAAAQASRAARRTYANVPSPSPEFDRIEPSMEDRLESLADDPYAYEDLAAEGADQERAGAAAKPAAGKAPRAARAPKPLGPSRFPLKSAIALGVVLVLAGAGTLFGPRLWSSIRGLTQSQPVAEAPKAPVTDNGVKPKIADRVGQPGTPSQIAPVAQKVVLYDEDPSDPQGKRYNGTVVWRLDQVPAANGQPPDVAVRADIEVPERKLKMTLSIRRNNDASLPASHTAELTFSLPPDFAGGGVGNVPGILMKSNEQTKGTPLAGLAVKVTDGFFLIGLSNVDADKGRNIQLLKERSWFDVPIVYTSQRRAILAVEKGAPGERAFNDAFAAWGQ